MLDNNRKIKLLAIVVSLAMAGFTANVVKASDISSVDNKESVVISITTDPTKDPEPACVALQIGRNLLSNIQGMSIPVDEVTVVLTTGGVELINPDSKIHKKNPKLVCTTSAGINTASLKELLGVFQGLGGSIVTCPLCATSRGITETTDGVIGNSLSIHNLFLYADKVLTF